MTHLTRLYDCRNNARDFAIIMSEPHFLTPNESKATGDMDNGAY